VSGLLWLLLALVILGIAAVAYFVFQSRLAAPPMPAAPPGPDPDDIRRELVNLLGSMVGKVSPDVLAKYQSIHRRMLAMLPRMGQLEGTSQDLFILHRTASDYLPTAVQSYLSLASAGTAEQPLPDGRTPHMALLEQLDMIETKLADISDALDRNDLDRLLIHGRFLEARFGAAPGGLGLEPPRPGTTSEGS
jgi:hypothetical protein